METPSVHKVHDSLCQAALSTRLSLPFRVQFVICSPRLTIKSTFKIIKKNGICRITEKHAYIMKTDNMVTFLWKLLYIFNFDICHVYYVGPYEPLRETECMSSSLGEFIFLFIDCLTLKPRLTPLRFPNSEMSPFACRTVRLHFQNP